MGGIDNAKFSCFIAGMVDGKEPHLSQEYGVTASEDRAKFVCVDLPSFAYSSTVFFSPILYP